MEGADGFNIGEDGGEGVSRNIIALNLNQTTIQINKQASRNRNRRDQERKEGKTGEKWEASHQQGHCWR